MILAYVTMCILELSTCAPEVRLKVEPFDTSEECWSAVSHFMDDHHTADASPVALTFRCGEEA